MQDFDLTQIATELQGLITAWGLKVIGALAFLLVGRWVAGRVRKATREGLGRSSLDATLIPFMSGIVYWGILAFVGVGVLGLFGIPTASFIAVLGAAGLAIGLAFQGTFSNFASGVMLLVFRPLATGDFVEVGGTSGTVQEVGIFTTILHTPDNVKIIVPNSSVFGETIKNFSANATRRIDLVMGVGYDDDLQLAHDTMKKVLESDERVLEDPAPVIAVHELADSSVNFVVRPWCQTADYWQLRWDLIRKMKEELEAVGCNIPYPQRDLHLFQADAAS